jgi:hypothetical protein
MHTFLGKTRQGERINFGYKDIRNTAKDHNFFNQERPRNVRVEFSTVEMEKDEKEFICSYFPLAALVSRLGYH